jgi:thioredoxin 2
MLVDFWAPWCGPCRAAAPEVAKLARETSGRALVVKVNTDENPDLARRYQIQGIPTFAVFSGGRLLNRHSGVVGHATMKTWLDAAG